jgi:organic hydroperoxide reductase OsmC/OhrA
MSTHTAALLWERGEADFPGKRYSRRHQVSFDGGAKTLWSSSPHSVPVPWSDVTAIDPEEGFVASLASCHMLWFLALAAAKGYCIDRYVDNPVGVLERNAEGRMAMTLVTLHPEVTFSGDKRPDAAQLMNLHERAHEECFIANSVLTEVRVEPVKVEPASG